MSEPHRWHAGVLHGYWLATPEEEMRIRGRFIDACNALCGLPEVRRVGCEHYEITEDEGFGGAHAGEKWRVHFARNVVYIHRQPSPDEA